MIEYNFYALNRKNPINWLAAIVITGGFIVIPIVMGKIYDNQNLFIFGVVALAILIVPCINSLNARITINMDGIEYRSLIKSKFLNWRDVQTIGVYTTSNSGIAILEPKEYNIIGNKHIFITTEDIVAPFKHRISWHRNISNNYIHFQWRKKIFDDINGYWVTIKK